MTFNSFIFDEDKSPNLFWQLSKISVFSTNFLICCHRTSSIAHGQFLMTALNGRNRNGDSFINKQLTDLISGGFVIF